MSKLKILQINKYYYLRGGTERHVFELEKLLREKGHIVIPFSMQDSRNNQSKYDKYFIKKIDLDKFRIKNIIKFFYNYEAVRNLKKLIKNEKPDIAHLHNIAHHLSPAIIKTLEKYNIPVIQTLHDYKLICPNYRLFTQNKVCARCKGGKYFNCYKYKCVKDSRLKSLLASLEAYINNKIYTKVDLFIAPSQYMRNKCIEFGVPGEKIKTIYNFLNNENKPSEFINSNNDYLLYFGRISNEKGINVLIDAVKDINIKLKIVGTGPEVENLKFKISNFKLNNIEILGPKYGEELNELIRNARAVVMPSIWPENMPYSLLESLAFNVPVIVSNIGGMPEVIKDRVNGYLFKTGDKEDLKDKIEKIDEINHDDLVKCNQEVLNKNSQEKYYQKIEEVYLSLKNEN